MFRFVVIASLIVFVSTSALENRSFSQTRSGDSVPPQKIATNLKGFTVPFRINNQNGKYIEVHLYVSANRGDSWNFYAKQDVNQDGFKFTCQQDGEYWFALKTLDRNRRLIPVGNVVQPELSIVVDTQKPKIEFDLSSDAAGRIISRYRVEDDFITATGFKMQHRDAENPGNPGKWLPVTGTAHTQFTSTNRIADSIAWWPQTNSRRIEVKLTATDRAGNQNSVNRTISLPTTQRRGSAGSTAQVQTSGWKQRNTKLVKNSAPQELICKNGVCNVTDQRQHQTGAATKRPNPFQLDSTTHQEQQIGSEAEFVAPPAPEFVSVNNVSGAPQQSTTQDSSIEWKSKITSVITDAQTTNASTLDSNSYPTRPVEKPELGINHQRYRNVPVVNRIADQDLVNGRQSPLSDLVVSESTTKHSSARSFNAKVATRERDFTASPNDTAVLAFPKATRQNTTSRPTGEVLSVNTLRFNLNYGVKAIDTSGVGKVILWATEDGGNRWSSWATDPDNISPFPVEVEQEGQYGFRVTINSKDGLIGKAPSSGDRPDIVVNVDTSTPVVRLTSAPYGSGNDLGKLILHWQASDAYFKDRPIDLFYSPKASGPWTTIAKRLRNSGSYAWKVPSHAPENVFLRIDARDEAGNVGVFQLTSPVDLSGLVPRGQILGVEPVR